MNDVWNIVREAEKEEILHRKLSFGIYCFKMLAIKSPKTVVNEYDKIFDDNKEKYMKSIYKNKDDTSKYSVCDISVRVWHWASKVAADSCYNFSGKILRTHMTLPILQLMRSQLDRFIEHKIPEPELILYWKVNKLTVKYTFIYEKDFELYKPYIGELDKEVLEKEFYWMGRKEYFDEQKMLGWYKDEVV